MVSRLSANCPARRPQRSPYFVLRTCYRLKKKYPGTYRPIQCTPACLLQHRNPSTSHHRSLHHQDRGSFSSIFHPPLSPTPPAAVPLAHRPLPLVLSAPNSNGFRASHSVLFVRCCAGCWPACPTLLRSPRLGLPSPRSCCSPWLSRSTSSTPRSAPFTRVVGTRSASASSARPRPAADPSTAKSRPSRIEPGRERPLPHLCLSYAPLAITTVVR